MDVISCRLTDVGGRKYRVQSTGGVQLRSSEDQLLLVGFEDAEEEVGLESLTNESLIKTEGDIFVTRISADAKLLPFIIGREGSSRKRVEQDTGANLWVPRRGHEGCSEVVIRGPTKQSVSSARIGVEVLIDNALSSRRLDYTHFVSLPLNQAAVMDRYEKVMKEVVLEPWAAECGIEESIFMKPQHLHLTLVMLKLYSDEMRHRAKQVLRGMKDDISHILSGQPLTVSLKGLQYMNDDPSAMHVLYIKVQEPDAGSRLNALCELVMRSYVAAGLLQSQDERPVKLHATMLNSRYRTRSSSSGNMVASGCFGPATSGAAHGWGQQQERQPFDGRRLLQERAGLDLGTLELAEMHLSKRGAYDDQGYYQCAQHVALQ